jgi:hypothetical protein
VLLQNSVFSIRLTVFGTIREPNIKLDIKVDGFDPFN